MALRPIPALVEAAPIESPAITQIFRDATIYNEDEERWVVRSVNSGSSGEKFIDIEGHEGELMTITERQLSDYTRFKQTYRFLSIVNRSTDIDVLKAKAGRAKLKGNKVRFRAQNHTAVIPESCPDHFDVSAVCVYLKRVMFSKVRFELHSDLDFPVTEEMFKQIWLERLKEDKGYGETLRNAVKGIASMRSTVAGLMESLAGHL